MARDLYDQLKRAKERGRQPTVLAYNRIDGPGSSLDLREFQQSLWAMPDFPEVLDADPALLWTKGLPRTIGITIDTGTRIHAEPLEGGRIGIRSVEYGTEAISSIGSVVPQKENWLLKIVELFNLAGTMFVLHNLRPGIQSSGLGGSATATTGTCILANELAGRPFSGIQLISMASRLEQDFGVSITGTQEQSNVIFGGVIDYVWFPWGIPGDPNSGYGSSIRSELTAPSKYRELEQRMAIFHSGRPRASTDVNSAWMRALAQPDGYQKHRQKLEIAYRFREAIRLGNWQEVVESLSDYREVRASICPAYLDGSQEILGFATARGCAAFPLGAGGGGGVLVAAADPEALQSLRMEIVDVYREIPFRIRQRGHEILHLPLEQD